MIPCYKRRSLKRELIKFHKTAPGNIIPLFTYIFIQLNDGILLSGLTFKFIYGFPQLCLLLFSVSLKCWIQMHLLGVEKKKAMCKTIYIIETTVATVVGVHPVTEELPVWIPFPSVSVVVYLIFLFFLNIFQSNWLSSCLDVSPWWLSILMHSALYKK